MAGMAYTTCMTEIADKMYMGSNALATNKNLKALLFRIMGHTGLFINHMSLMTSMKGAAAKMVMQVDSAGIVAMDTHRDGEVLRLFTDPNSKPVAILNCDPVEGYSVTLYGMESGEKRNGSITISTQGMSISLMMTDPLPRDSLLRKWFPDLRIY